MVRSFEQIEDVARRLRQSLSIDALLSPDLESVLGRLHLTFPGFRLIRVSDRDLPDSNAVTDCRTNTIIVRESVYQDALRGEGRARMTLAHEISHLALGHSFTRHRKLGNDSLARFSRQVRREESEAKRFAAVFLVPTHLAESCNSAEDLAQQFQVSREAAEIRKSELEARVRKQAGEKRPLPTLVINFLTEARKRGRKITSLD